MNFRIRHAPYLASLVRSSGAVVPSEVFEFSGGVYNRFTGAAMSATPTEYTLAAWLRPSQVATSAGVFTRSNGFPSSSWSHSIIQYPTYWNAYTFDGGVKNVNGIAPQINTWHHVAASAKNGGFEYLYVNGVSRGTPVAIGTLWTGGNDWWIAVDNGSSGTNYSGYMCEAAIWNVQLTDEEVMAVAVAGRGGPALVRPANLILYCPMADAPVGAPLLTDWNETVGGLTQSRVGSVVGRSSTLPVIVPPIPPVYTTDDYESYAVGYLWADGTAVNSGTNWNGAATIYTPAVATDDFEYYLVGTITDAGTISAGTNWSGGAVQVAGMIATDTFESYGTGPVYNGSNITGGDYWNGAAQVY